MYRDSQMCDEFGLELSIILHSPYGGSRIRNYCFLSTSPEEKQKPAEVYPEKCLIKEAQTG